MAIDAPGKTIAASLDVEASRYIWHLGMASRDGNCCIPGWRSIYIPGWRSKHPGLALLDAGWRSMHLGIAIDANPPISIANQGWHACMDFSPPTSCRPPWTAVLHMWTAVLHGMQSSMDYSLPLRTAVLPAWTAAVFPRQSSSKSVRKRDQLAACT